MKGVTKRLTQGEVLKQVLDNANYKYAIDIDNVIAQQRNPQLSQELVKSQQYQQKLLEQQSRPPLEGQMIGILGRTPVGLVLGGKLPQNLATYPNVSYLASTDPNVYYRRTHKLKGLGTVPTAQNPGKIMEFVGTEQVPMADWDFPGPDHPANSITNVRTLGDAEERVQQYVSQNPEAAFRLYRTPGGIRAWDLTTQANPHQYARAHKELDIDPNYARISREDSRKRLNFLDDSPYQRPSDAAVFFSRISPKPGRTDYVAQPIGEIRGAKAQMNNPVNQKFVRAWHDDPIRQAWLQGNAKQAAMETIKQDLPTASQFLQQHIRNYLNL